MIRKIKSDDYKEVKKLVYQIHDLHYKNRPDIYVDADPFPLDYFKEILNDENSFNYVYEEDNRIYGLLLVTKQRSSSIPIIKQRTMYYVENIVVDENYRRKGIAKKLYNYLLEKAEKDNIDSIELNVWAFNEDAIKFYESLGMTAKNVRMEQLLKNGDVEAKNVTLKTTNKVKK